MFEKIFQDYKGYINEMADTKVSRFKTIIHQENNDILLVWIGVKDLSNKDFD